MGFQICTDCPIHHYENCPDCWGFGLYISPKTGNLLAVTAAEAHGEKPLPKNLIPCAACSSTEDGIPPKETSKD